MPPTIAELIEALPEELRDAGPAEPALRDLLQRLPGRPMPVGRWRRMWALGSLPAKVAAGYAAWWVRGFGRGAGGRARALDEEHLRAALRLFDQMTYLRGAFMKLGQVLATYPDVVPGQFAEVLGRLHFEAPPMHFPLLRAQVRRELGDDPEVLFERFEPGAFAAASLGQVHAARLRGSGRRVAVKIQYPDIARTIRSDCRNMMSIVSLMRLSGDWDSIQDQVEDVRRMLELEVDYEHEARNMAIARDVFREGEPIVVPQVHGEFSTRRVLTMDHLEGVHLEAYLATDPPQESRDRFGHLIALAASRLSYGANLLYADPHPGNYLFMPDGRLGLLDFGCCVRYSDEDVAYLTRTEQAVHESEEAIREAMIVAGDLTPSQQRDERRLELMRAWSDWVWQPMFFHDGPFDFGDPEYFRRGMRLYGELIRRRYIRSRPLNTWLSKGFFGLRALLHHLRARVDVASIVREETTVGRG